MKKVLIHLRNAAIGVCCTLGIFLAVLFLITGVNALGELIAVYFSLELAQGQAVAGIIIGGAVAGALLGAIE